MFGVFGPIERSIGQLGPFPGRLRVQETAVLGGQNTRSMDKRSDPQTVIATHLPPLRRLYFFFPRRLPRKKRRYYKYIRCTHATRKTSTKDQVSSSSRCRKKRKKHKTKKKQKKHARWSLQRCSLRSYCCCAYPEVLLHFQPLRAVGTQRHEAQSRDVSARVDEASPDLTRLSHVYIV